MTHIRYLCAFMPIRKFNGDLYDVKFRRYALLSIVKQISIFYINIISTVVHIGHNAAVCRMIAIGPKAPDARRVFWRLFIDVGINQNNSNSLKK